MPAVTPRLIAIHALPGCSPCSRPSASIFVWDRWSSSAPAREAATGSGCPPGRVRFGECQVERTSAAQPSRRSILHDFAFEQAARRQDDAGVQDHWFEQSRLNEIAQACSSMRLHRPAEESCSACRPAESRDDVGSGRRGRISACRERGGVRFHPKASRKVGFAGFFVFDLLSSTAPCSCARRCPDLVFLRLAWTSASG